MIQQVEKLSPKLKTRLLTQRDAFGHREVDIVDTRGAQAVPRRGGERTYLSLHITSVWVRGQVSDDLPGCICHGRYACTGIAAAARIKDRALNLAVAVSFRIGYAQSSKRLTRRDCVTASDRPVSQQPA